MARIESIDLAKGIGIILVVWGHYMVPNPPLFKEIFYFHMPLFFILSGCFHSKDWTLNKLLNRIKRLYVPVIVFLLIFLSISFVKTRFGEIRPPLSIFSHFSIYKPLQFVDPPLWFLIVLSVNTILAIFLNKIRVHQYIKLSIALGISFVGTLSDQLPLYFTQALATFVFYYVGFCAKNFILRQKCNISLLVLLVSIYICMCFFNKSHINVHELQFGDNYVFYLFCGFSGSLLLIELCKFLPKNRFLMTIGLNSLMIMAIHQPIRVYFLQIVAKINSIVSFQLLTYIIFFVFLVVCSHYLGVLLDNILRRIKFI